jgi:hypothetical protein
MNSAKYLDYELRPAKFTERKMFLSSLSNICHSYGGNYQYIGFGGISFTDFKLFHNGLNINEMYSIEGGTKIPKNRINYNLPFHFIKTLFGFSTEMLDQISLEKKSIIWMDYDNDLETFMFEDIEKIFRKIPPGSVYKITCNTTLKGKDNLPYSLSDFEEKYDSFTPYGLNKLI